MQKIASVTMTLLMVLLLLPLVSIAAPQPVYADNPLPPEAGDVIASDTFDYDTDWYSSSESEFTISTKGELRGLAAIVNGTADGIAQDSFAGKTVTLTSDIDLDDEEWLPIGSFSANKPFSGSFDGADYTISGLKISSGADFVALFGFMNGELGNLTVSGDVSGGTCVAGIAAKVAGKLTNLTNRATVFGNGSQVGGIAADATTADIEIEQCHNFGAISNGAGERSDGKVAGIIGRTETNVSGTIRNCSNYGDINGYQYVAGIVGGNFGNVDVQYCFNSGSMVARSFGKVYLAGIVGKLHGGTIDSCYNTGAIYSNRTDKTKGHLRGIAGIVGNEENHPVGTAITNVYNTGIIGFDIEGMDHNDLNHVIAESAHISGGNQPAGPNQMGYANAFYTEGCFPQSDAGHPDSVFFKRDGRDAPAIWDTPYTTEVTVAQLKGLEPIGEQSQDILSLLGLGFLADENNINNGYPILSWQVGQEPAQPSFAITSTVLAGTATVQASAQAAQEGQSVSFSVTGIEAGKQVYSATVTDAAGNILAVEQDGQGSYSFTMPRREVTVKVVLEASVVGSPTAYQLALPQGLDAIWALSWESSYGDMQGSQVAAGATVFLTVAKNSEAKATSLDGVSAGTADINWLEGDTYYFVMPAADTEVTLDISYAPLEVKEKGFYATEATTVRSFTREQMTALATANIWYSGWSTETIPFIGRADLAVPLSTLLAETGLSFEAGDTLLFNSLDGLVRTVSYQELFANTRYHYPGIFTGSDVDKAELEPMLIVKGNTAVQTENPSGIPAVGDTLNTYRFVFGLTTQEFESPVKNVDNFPKYVSSVTVVKGTPEPIDDLPQLSDDGYYLLSTPEHVIWASEQVNEGIKPDIKLRLANDIDLSSVVFTPIGTASAGSRFTGSFDGATHIVTLLFGGPGGSYKGLFGYAEGATIKDIVIEGSVVGSMNIAGLVGYANNTVIENAQNRATVSGNNSNIGGIAGYFGSSAPGLASITKSANSGNVTGTDSTSTVYIGGIVGLATGAGVTISEVSNTGQLTGGNSIGGIIGEQSGGAVLIQATNSGAIITNNSNATNRSGGGITGYLNNGRIESSSNRGAVTGDTMNLGGIAGRATSAASVIIDCYNIGAVSSTNIARDRSRGGIVGLISVGGGVTVQNCFNYASVTLAPNSLGSNVGGIFGYCNDNVDNVFNNYYLDTSPRGIGASYGLDGYTDANLKALTAAQFKELSLATALGEAYAADLRFGTHPLLVWQIEPPAPGSGDLNADGVVSVGEAMIAAQAVVSGAAGYGLSPEQIDILDIDRDGLLTMADVVLMLRLAAGL
jgi:hypothetical protein